MKLQNIVSGVVLGQISEGEVNKRFGFLLQDFGLQYLRPKLFRGGADLQPKKAEGGPAPSQAFEADDYSMNTGDTVQPVLSMFGTPVFCDVILETQNGGVRLQLLDVLLVVNQQKNIVKTVVQGRSGTVKEYIAEGDFDVRLAGRLVKPFSRAYPKEDMADMIALVRANEPLKVTCRYLQLFGIFELVVEGYSFPQREGFQNIQLFDLQCCSDEPIQLQRRVPGA